MKITDAIPNINFEKITRQLYNESDCNGNKKKIILKRFKTTFAIVLMLAFLCYIKFSSYSSLKALYERKIEAVILDIEIHARSGRQIKTSPNGDYYSIYCNLDDILMKGDSISKQSQSDEFKVYRKSGSNGKWEHLNGIHLRKDLEFYSFVVKDK